MSIDAYAFCPGGTGKKIKFCCPDLLSDLDKITRMMQGEQFTAALQHIERLQQQPALADRACLLALKANVLQVLGQMEAAQECTRRFVEKHPESPISQAELAIHVASVEGGRQAMQPLQRALEGIDRQVPQRLYEAMEEVATALLEDQQFPAARALLRLQSAINQDDSEPLVTLARFFRDDSIPLLMKEDLRTGAPPADGEWSTDYSEAMGEIQRGRWQAAADKLGALAARVPDVPLVWRSLANARSWLADDEGCRAALRKLASLDIPLEDAVEAETFALLLEPEPFDDRLDLLNVQWTVADVDKLQEALISSPRAMSLAVDRAGDGENPPPRAAFLLLSRAPEETAENIRSWQDVPQQIGTLVLFGKQTDRDARLLATLANAHHLAQIKSFVLEVGKDVLQDCKAEVAGRISASFEMLQRRWHPPRSLAPKRYQELAKEHVRHVLMEKWPELKLGYLGGQSPREAADDSALRVKLLAAVALLEIWNRPMSGLFDFNELRRHLNLPTLEPIDPQQTPPEKTPLVRLSRVMPDRLSDASLLDVLRLAEGFHLTAAMQSFGREIVRRGATQTPQVLEEAYAALVNSADDSDQSLEYVAEGRKVAEAAGQSSAHWDLLELSLRFARIEGEEAVRLVRHIQSQHGQEPGIASALQTMLISVGLLRPDGTPVVPPGGLPPTAAETAPTVGEEPGKLWTPEAEAGGSTGKLWVPE